MTYLLDEILEKTRELWGKDILIRDVSVPYAKADFTRNKFLIYFKKAFREVIRKKQVNDRACLMGLSMVAHKVAMLIIKRPQLIDYGRQLLQKHYELCLRF